MDRLAKREKKLSAKLQKLDEVRKKLKRDLQLTRMKIAGARRRVQGKANKAVAALLAKTDPKLYERLVSQTGKAPVRKRRGRRPAKA